MAPNVRLSDHHTARLVDLNDAGHPIVEIDGDDGGRTVAGFPWSVGKFGRYIAAMQCERCDTWWQGAELVRPPDGLWLCLDCDGRTGRMMRTKTLT
jgi:hypothetical protein